MKFIKLQNCGNDFICLYTDNPSSSPVLNSKQINRLCDRHYGIGADGLLHISPHPQPSIADFVMSIHNHDGNEAEICGNGLCCITTFIQNHQLLHNPSPHGRIRIATKVGIKTTWINYDPQGNFQDVSVNLGKITLLPNPLPRYDLHYVSIGNPHAFMILPRNKSLETVNIQELGSFIEKHPSFSGGTNVEFIKIIDSQRLEMRIWERGCGETLSCSTGSAAVAGALLFNHLMQPPIEVKTQGGILTVSMDNNSRIIITSKATEVFDGNINLDYLAG